MQHINHNTTHLQNVNTCGLISKHPFVTNSKIYNHIWTHTFAQLRQKTTRPTGRAGYRHPSLWGCRPYSHPPPTGDVGAPAVPVPVPLPANPPRAHAGQNPAASPQTHTRGSRLDAPGLNTFLCCWWNDCSFYPFFFFSSFYKTKISCTVFKESIPCSEIARSCFFQFLKKVFLSTL